MDIHDDPRVTHAIDSQRLSPHAIGAPEPPAYTRRDYLRDRLLLEMALTLSWLGVKVGHPEHSVGLVRAARALDTVIPEIPPDSTSA